jgi:hypothetical protein
MKPLKGQLSFPFMSSAPEEMNKRNQDDLLKWRKESYPPTPAEIAALPPGARLSRHVHDAECELCPLCYNDHMQPLGDKFLVCLKTFKTLLWSAYLETIYQP